MDRRSSLTDAHVLGVALMSLAAFGLAACGGDDPAGPEGGASGATWSGTVTGSVCGQGVDREWSATYTG